MQVAVADSVASLHLAPNRLAGVPVRQHAVSVVPVGQGLQVCCWHAAAVLWVCAALLDQDC